MEIWANILELNGHYQISTEGRARRMKRNVKSLMSNTGVREIKERICGVQDNGKGYLQTYVSINKQKRIFYNHRLVAFYFIPNPQNKPEVNHKDGNKKNNFVENLEWVTTLENRDHAAKNNLIAKGEWSGNSILNNENVLAIRRLYRMNPQFNRSAVGRKFGVSETAIIKIIRGQRWKHLL